MVKKKTSKPKAQPETSFMFPSLHQDVVTAVRDNIDSIWFRDGQRSDRPIHEYTTHVMGRFRCTKNGKHSWASKMVAILIRGYAENGYDAEVFNQNCKTCKQPGKLTLDGKSYVERVAYRIQKWAGVEIDLPHYEGKTGLPHKSELCEGCRRGICRQGGERVY